MKLKKFFKILNKLYSPDFDKKGRWIDAKYTVKCFWNSNDTFSYAIYTEKEAYHNSTYESESFFINFLIKSNRKKIIKNIKDKLKELENEKKN